MNWEHAIIAREDAEVVSLEDAKRDLDVTFNDDDDLIRAHVAAASNWVEQYTNRFLSPTTVELYADRFTMPLRLPFAPFRSLSSLTAGGVALAPRTLAGEAASILPAAGSAWPRVARELGSVTVRYVVGYEAGKVPPVFAQAIKLITAIFYDKVDGSDLKVQWAAAENLLSGFRVRSL